MEQFSGPAEYALWQGDRFYRRTRPTPKQLEMRRPTMVGGTDPVKPPEWDFHQRLASYADHPNLLRRLGLIVDCVLGSEDALDALVAAATPAQGVMPAAPWRRAAARPERRRVSAHGVAGDRAAVRDPGAHARPRRRPAATRARQ